MCPLLILFNAQCLNLSNKKMVFVLLQQQQRFFYINLHLHSIQLSFLFSSFLVCIIFCFFYWQNIELESSQKFLLTISFTDGSSIECIKGVVVGWAWHPYNRLSPAQYEFVFLLTISASSDLTRFQDFLGIPRILAMKYACCAAKAKVMWLTWMLVMLCRLLLLLLLLGLRLSLKKKIEMKIFI